MDKYVTYEKDENGEKVSKVIDIDSIRHNLEATWTVLRDEFNGDDLLLQRLCLDIFSSLDAIDRLEREVDEMRINNEYYVKKAKKKKKEARRWKRKYLALLDETIKWKKLYMDILTEEYGDPEEIEQPYSTGTIEVQDDSIVPLMDYLFGRTENKDEEGDH